MALVETRKFRLKFAPKMTRRALLVAVFSILGGVGLMASHCVAEVGGPEIATWSVADSHVGSKGFAMVSRSRIGSKLFIWNHEGAVKAILISSGEILSPYIQPSGRVLFVERVHSAEASFRLYEADPKESQISIRLLYASRDFIGFPIAMETPSVGGIATIVGPYLQGATGNPVPKRGIVVLIGGEKKLESELIFSSIGRLCRIGEQRYLAVSMISPPISSSMSTIGRCVGGSCFIDVSLTEETISTRLYSKAVSFRGTLLGIGCSEVTGLFVLTSVDFPPSGGRIINVSSHNAADGKLVSEFSLPAESEAGPPTISKTQANGDVISLIVVVSDSKTSRGIAEVWSVSTNDGRITRKSLLSKGDSTYILREI